MRIRLFILFVIVVLAGSLFAACVKAPPTTEVTSTEAPTTEASTEAPSTSTEEVKDFKGQNLIVKISPDLAAGNIGDKTKEFEELYGVTVDYSEIGWDVFFPQGAQMLSTDEVVDVMDLTKIWWDEFPNKLTPLNDYFSDLIPDMVPSLVDYGKVGDDILALPMMPSYYIMFYNKDIFDGAGVKIPETLDEFETVLEKLNAYNNNYNFISDWTTDFFFSNYIMFMRGYGSDYEEVKDGKLKFLFDTPEAIAATKFAKDLIDKKLVDPGMLVQMQWEVTDLYSKGDIAMMLMWDMYAGFLDEETFAKTGYFPFPGKEKGMTGGTLDGHEYIGIPKSAQNVPLAVEYIKFIASHDNMKQRSLKNRTLPIYADLYEDPEVIAALPYLDTDNMVKDAVEFQFPLVKSAWDLRLEVAKQIHKAILGEISPEKAASDLQAAAEKFEPIEGLSK
ncbi:MAG: ABC transporter substrate-binding protein [Actinobacteria bacterium]|nr:ABC transporter substrate-binding protein [Actinomycetota bacterium]